MKLASAKQIVEFINKYASAFGKTITNANECNFRAKITGRHWYLFDNDCWNTKGTYGIWLPVYIATSKASLTDKLAKIERAFAKKTTTTYYNPYDLAVAHDSDDEWDWYDVTEARLKILGKIIECTEAAHTTAKATKKDATTSKLEAEIARLKKELAAYKGTVDISAETKVVQGIAFVNIEAKKFEYVEGSGNVDICWDSRSECDEDNQINHVINMYNKKLSQIKTLVDELTKAKAAGATHVIDSSYTSVKDFEFNK